MERTVRNLREISTTVYFNVPKGYEDLLPFLRADRELRENFFRRLGLMFYAGAGLSQPVWDAYRELAFETCGERIVMATGLGSTETSPMAMQTTWETDRAGTIGIPVPGVELKIVPARRQARSASARSQCHAGILAAGRIDAQSFRRGRLLFVR